LGIRIAYDRLCPHRLRPGEGGVFVKNRGVFVKNRGVFVRKRDKVSFDPKKFLAKVGEGKTVSSYRKDQIVLDRKSVV
jgi:hypothetical protein